MSNYVLGFFFDSCLEDVILIRKSKPVQQAGFLNGIGGKVEPNESPLDAMIREFKEEASHRTKPANPDWIVFGRLYTKDWQIFLYAARHSEIFDSNWHGIPGDAGEHTEITVVTELVQYKALPNLSYLIPMALNRLRNIDSCNYFDICEVDHYE